MGQVDTVIAVVGFDKDDKVVSVTIDTAQTSVAFDESFSLLQTRRASLRPRELGDEYG